MRFDSKAKTSKKDEARNGPEVIGKIKQSLTGSTPIHMVTCCGNSVRLADISSLIQSMPELQFNIWIDEADVVLGTDVAECHLNKWEASANVEQIVMITATPQEPDSGLCSRYGEIQLLGNVHEAYSGEYVAFSQCQHHPEAFGKADTYLEYVDRVLTNSPMGIGEIAYLPAKTRRKTHEAMQDMLLNNNHVNAVLIINGSSKTLTFIEEGSRTVVDLYDHDFNKKEIGRVISEVYRKYGEIPNGDSQLLGIYVSVEVFHYIHQIAISHVGYSDQGFCHPSDVITVKHCSTKCVVELQEI